MQTNKYLETMIDSAQSVGWYFSLTRDGYKIEKPDLFCIRFSCDNDPYTIADTMVTHINGWKDAYAVAIENVLSGNVSEPYEKSISQNLQMYTEAVKVHTELSILSDVLTPIIKRDPRI